MYHDLLTFGSLRMDIDVKIDLDMLWGFGKMCE